MAFKIVIGDKGKAWRMDSESQALLGKNVGDIINGSEISADIGGYELEITGGSDSAGFPLSKDVEGVYLKKLLLTRGFGMKTSKPHGLRKKKTLRGKQISETTAQINMKVSKSGDRALNEIFADQNRPKEEKKEEVPVAV